MLTHSECEGVYVIKKKKKRLHAGWRGGLISVRGKCQSFLPSFMCDISIGQFPGLKLCRRVDMKRVLVLPQRGGGKETGREISRGER